MTSEPTTPVLVRRGSAARALFLVVGTACLGLAVLGLLLPVLPTTPFLLVAAASFARGSDRLHRWLLANRTFGPTIRGWQTSRAIPRRAKWTAIPLMAVTVGTSALLVVEEPLARGALLAMGLGLGIFLVRIPSSD